MEEKKENICRLCLKHDGNTFSPLNDSKEFLKVVVPELDVELIADPVICEVCHSTLHNMYSFKTECLSVEQKLRHYRESTSESEIDLVKVLHFLNTESKESLGEDNFLSEFEVRDEEEVDILDIFPNFSSEGGTTNENDKIVESNNIPEESQGNRTSGNDKNEASHLPQSSTKKEKRLRCFKCRKFGHTSTECAQFFSNLPKDIRKEVKLIAQLKPTPCIYCGKLNHKNKNCPHKHLGMLPPPKPPGWKRYAPVDKLPNWRDKKDYNTLLLVEKTREENLARLGCPKCFQLTHFTRKECKKLKGQAHLENRKIADQTRKAKRKIARANLALTQQLQSQNTVAPAFTPQYHNSHNEGGYSGETRDYADYGGGSFCN